jgi:SAM-dependent methyltransferase/3-polyprenyl-4-hydroxybenzoate decarboxylase
MSIERRTRAPIVRIVDRGRITTVLGPRGAVRFEGDSAALLRAVLDIHARPVTRAELFAELAMRAVGPVHEGPISELCAILERDGVLVPARAQAKPFTAPRRVVLGISGAIAAVDAPALVRGLQATGCEVRVAMTRSARKMVPIAALEAITHAPVASGVSHDGTSAHVALAEWAELVVVWPATATTLARLASGDCSDVVAAIVTTTRAPVVIAPSMNEGTYGSPAVQQNLDTLRAHGRWIVHPAIAFDVAHAPADRKPQLGSAAPPAAMYDLIRHVLAEVAPRPRLPDDAAGWERLWAGTPLDQAPGEMPPAIGDAIAARFAPGRRLLDLGCGDGVLACSAAKLGYRVTATELAPTALGRARDRAGALPILFVLDDATSSMLDTPFDVITDVGLWHCLPRPAWQSYARTLDRCVAPGGSLLVVTHLPGGDLATTPVSDDDLRTLLPAFDLVRTRPVTLARAEARLVELVRSTRASS